MIVTNPLSWPDNSDPCPNLTRSFSGALPHSVSIGTSRITGGSGIVLSLTWANATGTATDLAIVITLDAVEQYNTTRTIASGGDNFTMGFGSTLDVDITADSGTVTSIDITYIASCFSA